MDSLSASLHLDYLHTDEIVRGLAAWDAAQVAEPQLRPMRWHVYLERYLRSATVAASTQIEGNPMTLREVDALLRGDAVQASRIAQLENTNYNHALELATSFALTDSFTWGESVVRVLNHQVLRDLPDDRQGRYRDEAVTVAGVFRPPEHQHIGGLMTDLVAWARDTDDHPLVRVALLHLNLVAIHPFLDGNGRTARVASSLEMMRCGIGASELISVEPYLAANRDEYFDVLHETLGDAYQPDRHTATPWVRYAVNLYAGRLEFEVRLREVWPFDIGTISDALANADLPTQWAPFLLMAEIAPLRTRYVADTMDRSMPTARAMLNTLANGGWLEFRGRTRAAAYHPGPRLAALGLRAPAVVTQYVEGQTLGLEAA